MNAALNRTDCLDSDAWPMKSLKKSKKVEEDAWNGIDQPSMDYERDMVNSDWSLRHSKRVALSENYDCSLKSYEDTQNTKEYAAVAEATQPSSTESRMHEAVKRLALAEKAVSELRREVNLAKEYCRECPAVLNDDDCQTPDCPYRHGTDRFITRRGRALVKQLLSLNNYSKCLFCGGKPIADLKFCEQCDAIFMSTGALNQHRQQKHRK